MVLGRKRGPQHLLMCPPLHSCAASRLARAGLFVCAIGFDGQKYDRNKTVLTQQAKSSNSCSFTSFMILFLCSSVSSCSLTLVPVLKQQQHHDFLSGRKHRQLKGLFRAAGARGPAGPPCQEGYSTGNTIHDTHTLKMHTHTLT